MSEVYDIAIVGGGLGGLVCANVLSREGFNVIVLEKNSQLGGSLQVFSRDKRIFDTGVHYIGALDEGQVTDRYFRYLGIRDQLDMIRMDSDCYEKVILHGDDRTYCYAQGMERFRESLLEQFPAEKTAIDKYCNKIDEVCNQFPLYTLNPDSKDYRTDETLALPAADFIESLSTDKKFTQVLGASNMLYAGERETSPFYQHALILNSYIQSAWRPLNGGSQIATALARVIRELGGTVRKRAMVVKINMGDEAEVSQVILDDGEVIRTRKVISNLHPVTTFGLVGEENFRKSFVSRIRGLSNSISSFTAHLVLKENTVKYGNYNIYYHEGDVWDATKYDIDKWPESLFVSYSAAKHKLPYVDSMAILCYMDYSEVKEWQDSYNTVAIKGNRGVSYEEFKQQKSEMILDKLEHVIPGLRENVVKTYASTPLTYRDYIGSPDGGMYGLAKDFNSFVRTVIFPRTSLPNLYFTGQNVVLHGVLGVTVGAITTCFQFVDRERLLDKIMNS